MKRRGVLARWLIGVGTLYAVLAVVTTVAYLSAPKTNEPDGCDGIGFGCTLPPNETAVVVGAVVGLALLPVCGIAVLIVAFRASRKG